MADDKNKVQNLLKLLKELDEEYAKNVNKEKQIAQLQELRANRQEAINELQKKGTELNEEEKKQLDDIIVNHIKQGNEVRELIKKEKEVNTQLEKQKKLRTDINNLAGKLWNYLNQNDKIIRSTILNLGMSGAKADLMRSSFEQSAGHVMRMGGNLEDIQTIMQGYADETGRASVLSASMVESIEAIGRGTGIGVAEATRLGAQFESMGLNADNTMKYIQGVVDTSERMGVNTTKVLKNVSDNFKRLNTYTFQQGVKGFAQMAMYAEKFHMDMNQALNAADVAKSLEGAVDLAANLQVMGGEFAKTDPFEMLFLSRNDPAKFTEKIADMTKGVVTFRKMSDGSFQKFISPADRDRMASVEKSLGMQAGELTKIAERQAEIQKLRVATKGMGLTGEQQDLIEGAAKFNSETGKFEVLVAGRMQEVSKLTKEQAETFKVEQKALADRAKEALTFDEAFKATINELKATLLPMLRGVNTVMVAIRPFVEKFSDAVAWLAGSGIGQTLLKWVGGGMAVGFLLMKSGVFLKSVFSGLATGFKGLKGLFSGGKKIEPEGITGGGGKGFAGGALKGLGTGAGVGAAAVGIGFGTKLAAEGIAKLADSMAKLDKTGLKALPETLLSLAKIFTPFAIGLTIIGFAGKGAAPALLSFGAAALMIGGAIGIAATGIGFMGEGLGKLVASSKGAGKDMLMVAGGIGAIAASLALFNVSFLGFGIFAATMGVVALMKPTFVTISKAFENMAKASASFTNLSAAVTTLKGSKKDLEDIQKILENISNVDITQTGLFSELSNLLKNPLKVVFDNKNLQVVSDITLNIDGDKFMEKVIKPNWIDNKRNDAKNGKTIG